MKNIDRGAVLLITVLQLSVKLFMSLSQLRLMRRLQYSAFPFDNTASMQRTLPAAIDDKCERM